MKRLLFVLTLFLLPHISPGQSPLLISELLYQPHSGEAEYVELYNRADTSVNLSAFHIVRWLNDAATTHYPLPDFLLRPHAYVALTKDPASVAAVYGLAGSGFSTLNVLQCNLPAYPNGGGAVLLSLADSTIVDRLDYSPAMHSPLLRNKAGVALERRSFDQPTNQPSNWYSASSLCGYGTPGYANSQSTEVLALEADFVLSSTTVSPDGDGYQDYLQVDYALERGDLMADAAIFDATGHRVEQLLNAALLGTNGTFRWLPAPSLLRTRYVLYFLNLKIFFIFYLKYNNLHFTN